MNRSMFYEVSPTKRMLRFDVDTITPVEMKQAIANRHKTFKLTRNRLTVGSKPDYSELYTQICVEALQNRSMKDRTLYAISDPLYYEEDGRCYRKTVSFIPASREDVQRVQIDLNRKMMKYRGRLQGLCPIRRDIFQQCFDEIIRQMTLDCPERGLLLLRIRSEQNMTLNAMSTLFSDGLVREMGLNWDVEIQEVDDVPSFKDRQVYNFQKINRREHLTERIKELKEICKSAQQRRYTVANQLEILRQKNLDMADTLKKKHSEDYHFVKRSNAAYKIHIDETLKAIASFADLDPVVPPEPNSQAGSIDHLALPAASTTD